MDHHISVETIVPADEKKKQETHVLKSDGTTERLVHKRRTSIQHHERQAKQEKEKREKRVVHDKQEKQEKREKSVKTDKEEIAIDKPRLGRTLTSQEESILLPLLQGLLAANGTDASKLKHENTPFREKEQEGSNKNSRSNSLAENNDKSKFNPSIISPMAIYFSII